MKRQRHHRGEQDRDDEGGEHEPAAGDEADCQRELREVFKTLGGMCGHGLTGRG